MKNITVKAVSILTGLGIVFALAFSAMQLVIFDLDRYQRSYRDADTAQTIGISEEDLMMVTETVLDYLQLKTNDMDCIAEIHGKPVHVFRQRELVHMVDVQNLFRAGFTARWISIVIALVGLTFLVLMKKKAFLHDLCFGYCVALSLLLFLLLIIGIAVLVDFYDFFILFHKILFTNDFWLLNADDMLIMMFPEIFFNRIAIALVLMITLMVIIPGIASLVLLLLDWKKRKNEIRN